MDKRLITLFTVLMVGCLMLTACGAKFDYPVCPKDSGIIGPCNHQVIPGTISDHSLIHQPSETYSIGGEWSSFVVTVQGGGWIYVDCSNNLGLEEDTNNIASQYFGSVRTQDMGYCTVSAKDWPKYDHTINFTITLYSN